MFSKLFIILSLIPLSMTANASDGCRKINDAFLKSGKLLTKSLTYYHLKSTPELWKSSTFFSENSDYQKYVYNFSKDTSLDILKSGEERLISFGEIPSENPQLSKLKEIIKKNERYIRRISCLESIVYTLHLNKGRRYSSEFMAMTFMSKTDSTIHILFFSTNEAGSVDLTEEESKIVKTYQKKYISDAFIHNHPFVPLSEIIDSEPTQNGKDNIRDFYIFKNWGHLYPSWADVVTWNNKEDPLSMFNRYVITNGFDSIHFSKEELDSFY